ncbi:hypothetical protein AGMMS49936_03800 [Endomicrobiia bacterium]|nr:hypothetical protein AGMMS49936_03800 [Endomicrobiia bacterium]
MDEEVDFEAGFKATGIGGLAGDVGGGAGFVGMVFGLGGAGGSAGAGVVGGVDGAGESTVGATFNEAFIRGDATNNFGDEYSAKRAA